MEGYVNIGGRRKPLPAKVLEYETEAELAPCPECGSPAEVLERMAAAVSEGFHTLGVDGSIVDVSLSRLAAIVTVQCLAERRHWFKGLAEDMWKR